MDQIHPLSAMGLQLHPSEQGCGSTSLASASLVGVSDELERQEKLVQWHKSNMMAKKERKEKKTGAERLLTRMKDEKGMFELV